ncbi:MAG: hypothetical protein L0Y50_01405 [Beijerinckiaceae bacterium]|nr:hypothetical protein [Beijerinckiaceae bacterium]MCI0734929.1 hypothetical protein [Beijerinckiaceae bacterium]
MIEAAIIMVHRHGQGAKGAPKICNWRHLVEKFFGKLNKFRRQAPCIDQTGKISAAVIYLAAAIANSG